MPKLLGTKDQGRKPRAFSLTDDTVQKIKDIVIRTSFKNGSRYIEYLVDLEHDMEVYNGTEHKFHALYQLSLLSNGMTPTVSQGVSLMLDVMSNELKDEFSRVLKDRGLIWNNIIYNNRWRGWIN